MSDVRHEWMRHFSAIEMRNDNNTHDGVVSHTRFRIMEDVVKNTLNNLQARRYALFFPCDYKLYCSIFWCTVCKNKFSWVEITFWGRKVPFAVYCFAVVICLN